MGVGTEAMAGLRPRVVALGGLRDPLAGGGARLRAAVDRRARVHQVACDRPLLDAVRAYRSAGDALARGGCEAVHCFDARYAPLALLLRRRYGVPASATVVARDLARRPWAAAYLRLLAGLDEIFVDQAVAALCEGTPLASLPLVVTPQVAEGMREPTRVAAATVARLLEGVAPGCLIVTMPWTADVSHVRWLRDAVAPVLVGGALCVVVGAPSRRAARLMAGASASSLRIHAGPLDAALLAAVARWTDVFVMPGAPRGHAASAMALLLASSGAPLVAASGAACRLRHEHHAFVVDDADPYGYVSTLNALLSLPAQQRHALAVSFAARTLDDWSPDAAAAVYVERFDVLLGRPTVPVELRAA